MIGPYIYSNKKRGGVFIILPRYLTAICKSTPIFPPFLHKWLQEERKVEGTRVLPSFSPPKPKLLDGLNKLKEVAAELFTSDKFRDSIKRSFVNVGLAPDEKCGSTSITLNTRAV